MAAEELHRAKAEHNRRFLASIRSDEFADWQATAAFYCALHLVEMLFARSDGHSLGHRDRNLRLKRHHPQLWRHYRPLYSFSLYARYETRPVSAAVVRTELIDKRLRLLEHAISAEPTAPGKPTRRKR